jgi:hypothetical protein
MAQTVKTFPLRDQSEIMGKLFQMVNSIAMGTVLMNPSSSEINNKSAILLTATPRTLATCHTIIPSEAATHATITVNR